MSAPLRIRQWRWSPPASRRDGDLVAVEGEQRGRLRDHELPMRGLGESREVIGRGKIVDRHQAFGVAPPVMRSMPRQDSVDAVGVAASTSVKVLKLAMAAVDGFGIVAEDDCRAGAARGAPSSVQSSPGTRRAIEQRQLAVARRQRQARRRCRLSSVTAAPPVSPWNSTPTSCRRGPACRAPPRSSPVTARDAPGSSARSVTSPTLDAVEQHRRAHQQPGHRAFEANAIGSPLRRTRRCSRSQ